MNLPSANELTAKMWQVTTDTQCNKNLAASPVATSVLQYDSSITKLSWSILKYRSAEQSNNRVEISKARNNTNVPLFSMSLLINCDGVTKADTLRLAAIKQPTKTRYEKIDPIANIVKSMLPMTLPWRRASFIASEE